MHRSTTKKTMNEMEQNSMASLCSNFYDIVPLGTFFPTGYPFRAPGAQDRNAPETLDRCHFRKEIDTRIRTQEYSINAASMGADEAVATFAAELDEGCQRSAAAEPWLTVPVRTKIWLIGCCNRGIRPPAGIEFQHNHARPYTGQGLPDPKIHAIHVQGKQINVAGKAAPCDQIVHVLRSDPGMAQNRRLEESIPATGIELFTRSNVLLVAIKEQTSPAVMDNQIGRITFHAVARADLNGLFISRTQNRENVEKNAILIILRKTAEAAFQQSV